MTAVPKRSEAIQGGPERGPASPPVEQADAGARCDRAHSPDYQAAVGALRQISVVARQLAAALKLTALTGTDDYPLYAWCDEGWTCEHHDCEAGRDALQAWRDVDAPASPQASDLSPAEAAVEAPIARMLRACAERIDAGERWQDALGDYGLVLLPVNRVES